MVNSEHMENQLRTENRQVTTMFGVIFLFILGHLLRVVLNVSELAHEVYNYKNENCVSKPLFWENVIISWMLKANFCIAFWLSFHFRCLFLSHILWWQFRHPEIFLFMWQPMILFDDYSARNMSNANQCKGPQTLMVQLTLPWLVLLPDNKLFPCKLWMQQKILPTTGMDISNLLLIMLFRVW